jgi:hypothetical protein
MTQIATNPGADVRPVARTGDLRPHSPPTHTRPPPRTPGRFVLGLVALVLLSLVPLRQVRAGRTCWSPPQ